MPDKSPWDDIALPTVDYNVRQVDADTAVTCYWGRDTGGACLFVAELEGNYTLDYRREVVPVRGIEVDLRQREPGKQHLVLTLENQVDRDLFEGLCRTLSDSLGHATDSASSLAVMLTHLRRWKNFFSGRMRHLSAEEVRGLFAELVFLSELIERLPSASDAVNAWLGPEKSHQDFIYGNTAVEVKSLSGTERSTVRISSEDQLEALSDALYLRIYRLSSLPESSSSRSLTEIVSTLQQRFRLSDVVDAFDEKLIAYGYVPLPEYDLPRFAISDLSTYRVQDGFPCLVRSQIPCGVSKVAYEIKLETIEPFLADNEDVYEGF